VTRLQTRHLFYKKEQSWFSSEPFDVPHCSAAYFYAVPNNVSVDGFSCKSSPTLLVDLRKDADTLLKQMKKSCRYEVNKAQRSGFTIKKNEDHQAFYRLYQDFVKGKGFDGFTDTFWPLSEQGNLYTCYHGSQLLAGFLTIDGEQSSRWLMSGSIRLSQQDSESRKQIALANRALVWEAICDAKARGKTQFDFGGYYTGDDKSHPEFGIANFKRSFGGEAVTFYNYSKIYSPLVKLLKQIEARLKRR